MSDRTRVVRIIARLNIGGPAIQAISLTSLMEPHGYDTTLVRGREEPDEGSMDDLAVRMGVSPWYVPALRRNPGVHDLQALLRLTWIVARQRPHIVHTHAAKAGTLGRLAAMLAPGRRRRVLVHTFHGHSLSGYFSSRTARLYGAIERFLARRTDRLIAVSKEVRDELVEMGVAPVERFEVIRLGFDLSPFAVGEPQRTRRAAALRQELGIPADARLVTLIARLVPIKRVDRFLRVAVRLIDLSDGAESHVAPPAPTVGCAPTADGASSTARAVMPDRTTMPLGTPMTDGGAVRFLVVGDGELRHALQTSEDAKTLGGSLTWAGFRRDMPDVCFASDVVVLTSDNEGTPVSLIEALAAGTPVVSTDVGGVATVVRHEQTGLLASVDDERALADAVRRVLDEPGLAERLAAQGRCNALEGFTRERLVEELDGLYTRLLAGG